MQNVVAVELNAASVLQVWLVPVLKSRLKVEVVKLPLAPEIGAVLVTVCVPAAPPMVNKSFQSSWDGVQSRVRRRGTRIRCIAVELEVQLVDGQHGAARKEQTGHKGHAGDARQQSTSSALLVYGATQHDRYPLISFSKSLTKELLPG